MAKAQLALPQLERIALQNFSLYAYAPNLELDLSEGVFCLVGANGLGKSTFLNTVTYGLTGVVPNPSDRFDSIEEHYRHNLAYAQHYFAGRVAERDREAATVSLTFRVAESRYSLTRPLFEAEALRGLTIEGDRLSAPADSFESDSARDAEYRRSLTSDLGLATFEQYVFLQHFAFTFDERRRLLFWDDKILGQALYIAFGVDPHEADRADHLRRAAERADSQARNLQYQVTTARRRLTDLQTAMSDGGDPDSDQLEGDYDRLLDERQRADQAVEAARASLEDSQLKLSRARAQVLALRSSYDEAFTTRFASVSDPYGHPLVTSALEDSRCGICGSTEDRVRIHTRGALEQGACPFCGSALDPHLPAAPESLEPIKELAQQLEAAQQEVQDADRAVHRLEEELAAAESELALRAKSVTDFERENERITFGTTARGRALDEIARGLRSEIDDALERKVDFLRTRDHARQELAIIQADLNEAYRKAERAFVPLFVELAESFLGLRLDVQLELKPTGDATLILSVDQTRRRVRDELSESQRYFVDIALRMALSQHMASGGNGATLYIDTPEGSLDVAYEARAGSMFAEFVGRGNSLLLTGNLSSSQLLEHLARAAGPNKMELVRMIDWTPLSDIQSQAEALFESAFRDVTEALTSESGV